MNERVHIQRTDKHTITRHKYTRTIVSPEKLYISYPVVVLIEMQKRKTDLEGHTNHIIINKVNNNVDGMFTFFFVGLLCCYWPRSYISIL